MREGNERESKERGAKGSTWLKRQGSIGIGNWEKGSPELKKIRVRS